jgi:hypothetical protein
VQVCRTGIAALLGCTPRSIRSCSPDASGRPSRSRLLVDADITLARRRAEDPHVDLLPFTGSTPAGRDVAQRTAARLGHSLLELGGNNAINYSPGLPLAQGVDFRVS